jgi:hypothetical protein
MSRRPEEFALDKASLVAELRAFRRFLGSATTELSERTDILPFFKAHPNLASLIGSFHAGAFPATVLKPELGLFGDYACDLAVGDHATGQFCFIEFENATADSLFKPAGAKGTPDWSPRLEHGLSQITDWFYLLAGNQHTPQFRSFFHTDLADYSGLLVIGRDGFLTEDLRHRLRWRSQNTMVAGKHVWIVTFDELLAIIQVRVDLITAPAASPKPTRRKSTP